MQGKQTLHGHASQHINRSSSSRLSHISQNDLLRSTTPLVFDKRDDDTVIVVEFEGTGGLGLLRTSSNGLRSEGDPTAAPWASAALRSCTQKSNSSGGLRGRAVGKNSCTAMIPSATTAAFSECTIVHAPGTSCHVPSGRLECPPICCKKKVINTLMKHKTKKYTLMNTCCPTCCV